jgi:hypothetical protein
MTSEESTKAKATREGPHGRWRAFWYITTHTAAYLTVVGLYTGLIAGPLEIIGVFHSAY